MTDIPLAELYKPLIHDFSVFVVDQLLATHETMFNERREHWESTVEVLAQNSINKELIEFIHQRLTPILVAELQQSVICQFHQDLEPKLSSTIATTLNELVDDTLALSLSRLISQELKSVVRQTVASELKRQNFPAMTRSLHQILSRQEQTNVYLRRISWLFGILLALCAGFGAANFLIHFQFLSKPQPAPSLELPTNLYSNRNS